MASRFPRSSSVDCLLKCPTNLCICSFADEPFLVRRIGSPSAADLTSLLESAEVNDHGEEENEGSGVNPGPDSAKEAVKDIVDSVRHGVNCFISY